MTTLQELYAERKQLETKEVTGYAGAMLRHQKLEELQKEIDYYELGDVISRTQIQGDLNEIESLQEEIDRLQAEVTEKRSVLMASIFGEHATI